MAWPTPLIHDWESWLGILWQQHLQNSPEAPLLLTELQERAVWKKITATNSGYSESIAALACEAWQLLSDFAAHGERHRPWSGWASSDAEAFRGWAARFQSQCRQNSWLSRSDLALLLERSIRLGSVSVPTEILLVGFDRLTPNRQALINSTRAAGASIHSIQAPVARSFPQIIEATDSRDELATCAWWARQILEANPASRIAVIVQEIDGLRGEIDRTFRRVLMPESLGVESDDAMPFEFSLGHPLATVPVIGAALLVLRWAIEPIEQAAISWLMMSGFLAARGDDLDEMAALDAGIRKRGGICPTVSLESFISSGLRASSAMSRNFLGGLRGLQRAAHSSGMGNRQTTFLDWTEFAEDLLQRARWPGGRPLDTTEYQAILRWEQLLGDVAGLSFDRAQVNYEEFVTTIDRYANETIFAPESRDAPIQFMGVLESAGQEFDALWFLGVDDRRWPSTAQPHSLLPRELQRKYNMPHATVDMDWEQTLPVTRRIAASSPHSVFSYSRRDDTGDLRSAPILCEVFGTSLVSEASQDLRATLNVPEEPPHRRLTEPVEDLSSVPWPRDRRAGGAEILRRQSACGFQSFAVRRLGAEEIDEPERGLNPRDRGNILHKVLESLWSPHNADHLRLQTRADLLNAIANDRLETLLRYHIRNAFSKHADRDEGSNWTRSYLRSEQERLHLLLLRWLAYEAERSHFTVLEHEKNIETEVNGLQLNLRVDRIDHVDGGQLILDYKTGRISAGMWEGERPDEPQLLLYATAARIEDLRGLLLANVRTGKAMGFMGRAIDARRTVMNDLEAKSPLVKNPLDQEMLDGWRKALSNLAEQFLAGDAEVAPKAYPKTCENCPLPALCRVAEISALLEEEEITAGEDKEAAQEEEGADD